MQRQLQITKKPARLRGFAIRAHNREQASPAPNRFSTRKLDKILTKKTKK